MTENIYDITIIGAGPSGLFAGFYAGMRKNKVQIIDSLEIPGGQLTALYPEKTIHDVPGYFAVKAETLVTDLVKQTAQFGVPIRLSEKVVDITPTTDQGVYQVTTTKSSYLTKSVIIATGNGSFAPKPLKTDEPSDFDFSKLGYSVTDKQQFAGKNVAVAGGGDSAIDLALMLSEVAASVSLIHRRDAFRAHESSVDKLHASDVHVLTPVTIRNISDHQEGLRIALSDDRELDVDHLIVQHGFLSNNKDIRAWSVDLEMKRQHFMVDSHYQTSCENIYAIGDTANYDGKLGLIVEGFKEGPHAVNQIMTKIHSGKLTHAHSTSLF
ncbi:NAD(P)/FAD-dependent oxidoreductase [Lactococcus raffinolactis]|jgi:ferredoxin/flavodoxin---NADP+ reductase|uniref:Ferredoxin--NADP reductase n=1 Tax=Pseudolactococcus raffinolactis TaxID=1366 RepID=A0A2A5SB67_9LACT|nr:NAD(P)/FAD-dependent oxidoreductase [Lactococcus raffinolactis]MBR2541294.1 NAD(P)/FAD-dependent oxidoreductase [Lactococcus sp.]MBW9329910.1 NAD(P)/FAD-dependent oxidoreductase [Lactococcus raffinolactis]MDN5467979.1 NAD(P)/FAD-dependent oxidoreductase [Lactococcus raffinolactis]MDN5494496.1 NAD(P)/FAD-dependent oxidoreductase [Lactococcus raffinolactis]MDN5580186.1 NAD(P)/FAD-dependent oxidoreductase [Lactococcus raffinolactis]